MFHYICTKGGISIVDVECWITKGHYEFIGGVCNIKGFLDFYDTLTAYKKEEFKKDFDDIDEMRGWFFEHFLPFKLHHDVSNEGLKMTNNAIKERLLEIADKYSLGYGSD